MIKITNNIYISENELKEEFVRASGPGGQNVNKVATAVQLRFNVLQSPNLPDSVKVKLIKFAGRRMTDNGVLIIDSRRYRSQNRNREEALKRLIGIIKKAAEKPIKRIATKPSKVSTETRIKSKKHRSAVKALRKRVKLDE